MSRIDIYSGHYNSSSNKPTDFIQRAIRNIQSTIKRPVLYWGTSDVGIFDTVGSNRSQPKLHFNELHLGEINRIDGVKTVLRFSNRINQDQNIWGRIFSHRPKVSEQLLIEIVQSKNQFSGPHFQDSNNYFFPFPTIPQLSQSLGACYEHSGNYCTNRTNSLHPRWCTLRAPGQIEDTYQQNYHQRGNHQQLWVKGEVNPDLIGQHVHLLGIHNQQSLTVTGIRVQRGAA